MWKVGNVEPVSVLGVDGYPYGFDVTTQDDKPVVSFAYTETELKKRQHMFGRLSSRRSP